jgi:hypothetical protein
MLESKQKKPPPKKAVASPTKRKKTDVSVIGGAELEKQVRPPFGMTYCSCESDSC